jgi:protease-4
MFSRRHPYLFFILVFTGIWAGVAVVMSLIINFGPGSGGGVSGEKVGVIEISGMITDSKKIIQDLKVFREDDNIKAIVLRINSPGGGVGPSQEIYREVQKTIKTKKVITSMGAVAASGGYYIAAATNGIVANPGTITGSIGVIMAYTNFQEIFKKIGLMPVVIKSGEFKDMGSPIKTMTPEERGILQRFVDDIHQQFVRDAAIGRDLPTEEMGKLADGRIFSGEEAKSLGLIDRIGNLEDAVEWAGALGGIDGKIESVYPREEPLSLLKQLVQGAAAGLIERTTHTSVTADYIYQP